MNLDSSNSFKSSLPHPLTRAPDLRRRQGDNGITCGYYYGNSNSPFTVPTDSTCTTVYPRGIWGLCTYSDQLPICQMYGACVDGAACSGGCYGYNFNTQDLTATLSCVTDYCQSSLLSDSSSPRLGVQTSYSCDTTSQISPALFFVSPLVTPYNLITSTTSSSDTSDTSSTGQQSTASSTTFGSEPTPGSFTSKPASSSEASTPQVTTVSSNHQATSSSKHTGAIIGGAMGGVVFIIFLATAIWLLHRHRKNHKAPKDPSTSSHEPEGPGDNIHELMGKNGHTPEIGGTMVTAEADGPSVDRAPAEMHSPVVPREPVEMKA